MTTPAAPAEPALDPVAVELLAIRMFTHATDLTGTATLDRLPLCYLKAEADWRNLDAEARDEHRRSAERILRKLVEDGVAFRTTKAATDTLHRVITHPATLAYALPGARTTPAT